MRRLTFGGKNRYPVWSADSARVAFSSDREGDAAIFWQRADGTGTTERLTKPEQGASHVPNAWSPDGKWFFFTVTKGSEVALWMFSVADKKAAPFGGVKSTQPLNAAISPDGRWVAYQSTETGISQLYAQPIPADGTKYQITKTTTSSIHPLWSRDGKRLLYIPGRQQFSPCHRHDNAQFRLQQSHAVAERHLRGRRTVDDRELRFRPRRPAHDRCASRTCRFRPSTRAADSSGPQLVRRTEAARGSQVAEVRRPMSETTREKLRSR